MMFPTRIYTFLGERKLLCLRLRIQLDPTKKCLGVDEKRGCLVAMICKDC